MKHFLLFIIFTISIKVNAQISPVNQSKVDDIFKQWNNNNSPGAALGIIQKGKIIYSRGYGLADLEHGIPITDSTIFYIGSVSKQFVTMCILLLEEQGKLKLNDRVQQYLPDFPTYDAPLTIQHFIHHTSGIRDNLTLWNLAGNSYLDHIDKAEMYQLIKRQKALNFTPGDRYLYSNSCYFILALIVEKISGQSLREFAQKNIFHPLGMHHSFFGDDNRKIIMNRAFSYEAGQKGYMNNILRYDLVGSGGLYSNVKDMYLWDQNFYHNKLGKGGQAIIEKMQQEGLLNNGKSCGYAFALQMGSYRGLKTVSHGGALAGYRSHLVRFPGQNFTVVLLGNLGQLNVAQLSLKVADILLEKELGSPVAANTDNNAGLESKEGQKTVNVKNLQQYAGFYYSEELDVTYKILEQNNALLCSSKDRTPFKLIPESNDIFKEMELFTLKFERNSRKEIIGFSLDAGLVMNLKFIRK